MNKGKYLGLDGAKNPLVEGMELYVTKVSHKDGGFYYADHVDCGRLYNTSGSMDLIYGLSSKGRDLLVYIVYHLVKNQDWVDINVNQYMRDHKVGSINTYKKAVKELVSICFIYPVYGHKNSFWINPRYLYKGNRLTMHEECLKQVRSVDSSFVKAKSNK